MAYFETGQKRYNKIYIDGMRISDFEIYATSVAGTDPVLYRIERKTIGLTTAEEIPEDETDENEEEDE